MTFEKKPTLIMSSLTPDETRDPMDKKVLFDVEIKPKTNSKESCLDKEQQEMLKSELSIPLMN